MKNSDLFNTFQAQLSELAPKGAHFKIALSGGLDSVVLLHLFSRLQQCQVSAHHVHHGLSKNADDWLHFCTKVCASFDIPIVISHVNLDKKNRTSLEALAREKRYAVLKEGFCEESYLVTGHHQDDQLETVLLALKRGAGLTGLQGIIAKQSLAAGYLIRPLLNFSREQLEGYAQRFSLNFIEDESNADQQFDRNFIRHSITPLLKSRWPAITKTVARSAGHCQSQQKLIDEITEADFQNCQLTSLVLNIDILKILTKTRRNNVLRYWFKCAELKYPSTKQLFVIWHDLVLAQADAEPKIILQGRSVYRYQQAIYLVDEKNMTTKKHKINWQSEQSLTLNTGRLTLKLDAHIEFLNKKNIVEVCFRKDLNSDFRCQPNGRGKSRRLKKLLHEYHVPPWLRDSVPLIFINGELVEVVDVFNCTTTLSTLLNISVL